MYDSLYLAYPLVDLSVRFEGTFPIHVSETRRVPDVTAVAGGSASTILMGIRLGSQIAPYGAVGDDLFGRMVLGAYRREGVPDCYLSTISGMQTPKIIIPLSSDGEHCFLSMTTGSYGDLSRLEEAVQESRSVIVSGYQLYEDEARQGVYQMIALAKRLGKTIFFDPGPLYVDIPKADMRYVLSNADVLLCNEDELKGLTGQADPTQAVKELRKLIDALLVLKAGAKGCYVINGRTFHFYPGFSVKAVDTTGAGDSFLAAFLLGYVRGWPMERTAELANAVGAAKAAKRGSGSDVPTPAEVRNVMAQRPGALRYYEMLQET